MRNKKLLALTLTLASLLSACGTVAGPVEEGFLVTFKDENGQTLESKKWEEGTTPTYSYSGPTDTAEWDYSFEGWSLTQDGDLTTISPVSAEVTYYAIVNRVKQIYTISFFDENGEALHQESYEYGSQPAFSYAGPADNAEWDYTFEGWSLTAGGAVLLELPTVTGNGEYYAIVGSSKKTYQISFYDENDTLLTQTAVAYGAKPSNSYAGPTDTAEWDYTFSGWASVSGGEVLDTLPNVEGSASYYAIVHEVKQRYTVTFVTNGGSSVAQIENEYGASISKPTNPTKDGHNFVAWSYDSNGAQEVSWPLTLIHNEILYANWNETIDIKSYLQSLMSVVEQDPYSYIPESMRPTNSANHVAAEDVDYDFDNFTNVSSIKYGGYGEQWHMVIENIEESERFYSVLSLCETAINASVVLFNNYLDNNPSDTASHSLNETEYTAELDFSDGVLTYILAYKTNLTIPFLGEVLPQIAMTYNISTFERAVRIQLTENNAMKYIVQNDSYIFALEYGVESVSRKAYFSIEESDDNTITGHIYEYVQFKDKDLMPSCADFYIDDTYTSVVGNKASGMPGFAGYINELYKTDEAKLLGYEVRETFEKWGFEQTYNSLFFNLNNISGINNIKAIKNDNSTFGLGANNNHDIYLNNSSSIFEPTFNSVLFVPVSTSRKYDIELRKQYFYGYVDDELSKYETSIPMMFIQADNDIDTNFSDFPDEILSKSGIAANVTLSQTYLDKIQADYDELIDIFIENLGTVTGEAIENFVGDAIVIE